MSVNPSLAATDPQRDASVHASAGTGKTWLLVTRVVRLLLAGAHVDGILAITFTRKAAAEMEQRIMERLQELACADAQQLDALLEAAGIPNDTNMQQRAMQLYEDVLRNPRRLHCTTFHAFCQDLLARFPLEAGVPPGFEVAEKTGQLEQAAYDSLLANSTAAPDHPVTQALDRLATACDSLASTQKALYAFLDRRSDWWAWTETDHDAVGVATARLTEFLGVDPTADPLAGYPDDSQHEQHREFAQLLRNNTARDSEAAAAIDAAQEQQLRGRAFLERITAAYLTKDGRARTRKHSAAQEKRLQPHGGEARFLALHAQGCEEILQLLDRLASQESLAINSAWYIAGHALLENYQRIKREQRIFDFADLEWQACRLLNRSDHAGWVQYKLDARIDHLLVDEFQDTNPTQWRMLQPLLDELAAGDSGRDRSVFLVGDRKQSIYGFRRANPTLLETASRWLETNRDAERYPLDLSRRSAQAIMDCVNRVFGQPGSDGLLADFRKHRTHLPEAYGRVELLPICTDSSEPDTPEHAGSALRNPLHEPRAEKADSAWLMEGRQIAHAIQDLLATDATCERDGEVHTIGYSDVLILLRQRSHARYYEQALREADIPCLGASRGMLLENLEVRDMVALLNILISPYDNLALAQVLRSPLFDLDSEALLALAGKDARHWYAHMAELAGSGEQPWTDVYRVLEAWRALAGQLPVHDLLDRIFHEGEIMQRYERAFPARLLPRLRASFTRFIELALELDNGRYPSLPRFLDQLERLRASNQDQPDESTPDETRVGRVRLMTVHAAKGLESPVVFLADAATVPRDRSAWSGCVDWPDDTDRPDMIVLAARRNLRDRRTQQLLDRQADTERHEDANLLYVALTRARQYLFVSGSASGSTRNTGWYGMVESAFDDIECRSDGRRIIETGTAAAAPAGAGSQPDNVLIDVALSRPVRTGQRDLPVAPSRQTLASTHGHTDIDGRERGIALHLILERLTGPGSDRERVLPDVASRLQRSSDDPQLLAWWREACAVIDDPALSMLFDSTQYRQAWNEVAVQYLADGRMVHGVIDRMLLAGRNVFVIDYKTHRLDDDADVSGLLDEYRPQLQYYANAARQLWPELTVRCGLLFTGIPRIAWQEATDA